MATIDATGLAHSLTSGTSTISATQGAVSGDTLLTVTNQASTPVITPSPDVTAEATGPSGAAVSYPNPTATDAIDGTVPVICLPASGATFAVAPRRSTVRRPTAPATARSRPSR